MSMSLDLHLESALGAAGDVASAGRAERVRRETARVWLRRVAGEHGFGADMLCSFFAGQRTLQDAVDYVFGLTEAAPTRTTLRRLASELQDRLDLHEPLAVDLASPVERVLRSIRNVFALVVFGFSLWTVIGAVVTGQSAMAQQTSAWTIGFALLIALAVLGLLEAAHIGAVALSTADVSALAATHPRVVRQHRHIDTPHKLEHYLAARQVGVVLVVFLVAAVTRTDGLGRVPGTSIELPGFLDVVFQIGAPGALLVLIVAQVAPQILTARRPAAVMNLAPMSAAFYATLGIGTLGLARPASWLVMWSTDTERIPSAPRQRFEFEARDVAGFGVLSVQRDIRLGLEESRSATHSAVLFHDDALTTLAVGDATVPTAPVGLKVGATLRRGDAVLPVVVPAELEERRLSGGIGTRIVSRYAPRVGTFREGDVLEATTAAVFAGLLTNDFVQVEAPTKLVVMRVVIEHPPAPLPPAILSVIRAETGEVLSRRLVAPRFDEDDASVELFATVSYAVPGTLIHLNWTTGEGVA